MINRGKVMAVVFILVILLAIPATLIYKKTIIGYSIPLIIITGGGIFGLIFNGDKLSSSKTARDALFVNFFAWGLLFNFLFIGTNYLFNKGRRQHTFPISNRYLKPGKHPSAIAQVANTNFDYEFKFKKYEMEDVNQADSIAITFTEGILGYIIIRDYHLISNP